MGTTPPELQCSSESNPLSCQLLLASFTIQFEVHHCGHQMPLMNITNNGTAVQVGRLASGSPPVTGTFDLSFNGETIRGIPVNVTAARMKEILENGFPDQGGFTVTHSDAGEGFKWTVRWMRGGDQPLMTANDGNVMGLNASVTVQKSVDGGVYIRPFRGDMLRLPELSPQVGTRLRN